MNVQFAGVAQGTEPETYRAEVQDRDGRTVVAGEIFPDPNTASHVAQRMWQVRQRNLQRVAGNSGVQS